MQRINAWVAEKGEAGPTLAWTELSEGDLMAGNVTIRVSHSTINYKDALAVTGKAPIIRRWPMIPGIDLAGTVTASTHPDFKTGEEVILNGWEAGVSRNWPAPPSRSARSGGPAASTWRGATRSPTCSA
jgi:acrylyl-CoA reductase (NADPH)